ncbi:MAG: AtpZ/AtpI family protein [Clostridiales bacterium]|nr:AtpZ/AtpI family protein [Clostridiales bacterium]
MRELNVVLRQMSLLGQLGLSLAAPLLLCLFVCYWIHTRFGVGVWVYIPGFFFGLGGSFAGAYRLYLAHTRDGEKESGQAVSFNEHR